MALPEPPTPGGSAGPSGMSRAEKLACEWEARHDVAARRRPLFAAPLQEYLNHARCEDLRRRAIPTPDGRPDVDLPELVTFYGDAASVRARLRCGEDVLSYFPLAVHHPRHPR